MKAERRYCCGAVGLTLAIYPLIILGCCQTFNKEVVMAVDLRKLALRMKVTEMLGHYYQAQKQMRIMSQWKKLWIHPN
jgi:hypothetical protein